MKMLSKKQYDLVSEDGYDTRIPLHNDEAFQHGIHFQAKYIGTLDVPRPSSRVEIVAAMRKIRYEFKAKAIKKKKVCLTISVDGVKVSLRKKPRRSISSLVSEDSRVLVMHHPIFRIFYVSHDSQDLKILSYIARDGPTNCFKCNVFKAYKKSQAMRIVRTIGQAFEVCHKLSIQAGQNPDSERSTHLSDDSDTDSRMSKTKDRKDGSSLRRDERATPPNELALKQAENLLLAMAAKTPVKSSSTMSSPLGSADVSGGNEQELLPITAHHHVLLLREQLEQQQHQTQLAIGQVHLLKDQLTAETAARIEAQARAHQLLMHNRDVLHQMGQLVTRLHDMELKVNGITMTTAENIVPPPSNLQIPILPDPTTPQAGPVYTPDTHDLDPQSSYIYTMAENDSYNKNNKSEFETDSPDSGHKEMSSESLSLHIHNGDAKYWFRLLKEQPVSFSSPEGFLTDTTGNFFDLSSVTGNPFANGYDDGFDQSELLEDKVKIITPLPLQDASGNKLDLKLKRTPRIDPPPEFRNSKSYRDSQYSVQSSDSVSSQDMGCVVKTNDSDYFSNTASSSSSQVTQINNEANLTTKRSQISTSNSGTQTTSVSGRSMPTPSASSKNQIDNSESKAERNINAIPVYMNSSVDHTGTNSSSWMNQISKSDSLPNTRKADSNCRYLESRDIMATASAKFENGFADLPVKVIQSSEVKHMGDRNKFAKSDPLSYSESAILHIKPAPPPPPPRNVDKISVDDFQKCT